MCLLELKPVRWLHDVIFNCHIRFNRGYKQTKASIALAVALWRPLPNTSDRFFKAFKASQKRGKLLRRGGSWNFFFFFFFSWLFLIFFSSAFQRELNQMEIGIEWSAQCITQRRVEETTLISRFGG